MQISLRICLGDDSEFNANKIIDIFKGEDNDFSKAVCLNAAAGLIVSEKHIKFIDAYQNAKEHILSGKTYEHLKNIQNGWITLLEKIIKKKAERLIKLKKSLPIESIKEHEPDNMDYIDFRETIESNISQEKISIIAEIKKASPSAGIIVQDYNPVQNCK